MCEAVTDHIDGIKVNVRAGLPSIGGSCVVLWFSRMSGMQHYDDDLVHVADLQQLIHEWKPDPHVVPTGINDLVSSSDEEKEEKKDKKQGSRGSKKT
jgi:hypothetical protein